MEYNIRWYMKMNLRAVYWLTELRSGQQGHPNYRRIAQKMYSAAKNVHPLLMGYATYVDMNEYTLARLESEKKKKVLKKPEK